MNSIERLIERINGMQEEIHRLVEGLVRRGMRERATAVETAVIDVEQRCRDAVREMYPPTEVAGPAGAGCWALFGFGRLAIVGGARPRGRPGR